MNSCNNDACYDRNVSSVDPYKKGDIAAWGSEREVAERERQHREEQLSYPPVRKMTRKRALLPALSLGAMIIAAVFVLV